jgi:hypothetical protein
MPIEFGRVPHPPMEIRQVIKPERDGWDDLGQRTPRSVVLHRMVGTLMGTDSYFRQPGVGALTDYGVGVSATDGLPNAGRILRWNDPRGRRSGWANGRVSKPYDDGLKFLNRYGINGVNRDCVSIEISGNYDTALDVKAKASIAALVAYWADQYNIPHTEFPFIRAENRNFTIWHQEFTIGTGKICPGAVVMQATDEIIDAAKKIMAQYQEVGVSYAKPSAIPALSGWNEELDGLKYFAIERKVKASKGATFHAAAARDAAHTRPPAGEGEEFRVSWVVSDKDGVRWWVTPYGSRVMTAMTNTDAILTGS